MPKSKKLKIPIERQAVDMETGEIGVYRDELIVTTFGMGKWIKITSVDKETDWIPFDGLGKQFVVFYLILKRVVWEDCTVDIGPSMKKAVERHVGIKDGMLRRYLKEYVDSRLLRKLTGPAYMVNPAYFFVGDETEQKRLYKKFMAHGNKF